MENINNSSLQNEANGVKLIGTITTQFVFSHEIYGEKFYSTEISVERSSGTYDYLPLMISERLIYEPLDNYINQSVIIFGQIRSYNDKNETKSKLLMFVFAKELEFNTSNLPDDNQVFLNGFLCKEPVYRKTPLNREISDIILAVNRQYRKSDYIPCICWGRNARYSYRLQVGQNILVAGRIQSRDYEKYNDDTGEVDNKTAYEVSIQNIQIIC